MSKGILKEGVLGVLQIQWQSLFKNYRKKVDAGNSKRPSIKHDDMAAQRK